jgi:hypothetical protein
MAAALGRPRGLTSKSEAFIEVSTIDDDGLHINQRPGKIASSIDDPLDMARDGMGIS